MLHIRIVNEKNWISIFQPQFNIIGWISDRYQPKRDGASLPGVETSPPRGGGPRRRTVIGRIKYEKSDLESAANKGKSAATKPMSDGGARPLPDNRGGALGLDVRSRHRAETERSVGAEEATSA
ncbi:hypothetical protein Dimus_003315 [Dionaea muscipula]